MTHAPLSRELREATAAVHDAAESSGFMTRLLTGEISVAGVADYTAQLWFIYQSLEGAVRRASRDCHLSVFHDSRLERVPALEEDLDILEGPGWRGRLEMLPATEAYVGHLETLSETDGLRVLAHHYVRYLGDVSGGQVIARMLARHYGQVGEEAANFYDFSPLGRVKPFRDRYREGLDGLVLDAVGRDELLAEAVRAFSFNAAVFDDLGLRY